jgi:UDP-N-acetylmuramyl pentapeptide phosphotransferase/UDP-N-acetylglucosamine-1-phosphate transferase
MLIILLFGLCLSTVTCLLIVRYQNLHADFTSNSPDGPQKFHDKVTPRIGGLALFIGIFGMWVLAKFLDLSTFSYPIFLAGLPVFLVGFLEDVTQKIGVKIRLFAATISGLIAVYLYGGLITHLDIPWVDTILTSYWVAAIFTCFGIAGLANAYNLIDGFNGLASMVGMIALAAIAYIAFKVGDSAITFKAFVMIAAILGFFIWNYPRGLIFLGDGGAYLIGYWVAVLSILLVYRHQEISPWFALLVNAYPVTETLFTIWRRMVHHGKNPGLPDAAHFHSLIYRKLMRWVAPYNTSVEKTLYNAATSPFLWVLSSLGVFPALIFWQSTPALMTCTFLYVLFYVWCYRQVIRFRKKGISKQLS